MHERVTSFEPHGALFVADDDALLFYRKLSGFALKHLNAHGSLFVEINEIFGNEVVSLFESAGFRDVQLRKDMQGKDRMVKADI
jgi:release factor glutamine methyltransferase